MSPLARSLLALVTLFVSACAQSNCNTQTFGERTAYNIIFQTVKTPREGARIEIPNYCGMKYPGYIVSGEDVEACNNDLNGEAPDVRLENPPDFSMVDVACPDDCPVGATVYITQYCRVPWLK